MAKLVDLVQWKYVKHTSLGLYLAALLTFLISPVFSTLLIFSIFCFWSRSITMVNDYAKDLDVVDIFSVIVSINLGGLTGFIFAFLNMSLPRFFGTTEPLNYTIKDSMAMAFAALFTPYWYSLTGQNILLTMYIFTAQRYVFYIFQTISFDQAAIGEDIIYLIFGPTIAFFMNTILIKIFGNALTSIINKGTVLTVGLFLFVTFSILLIFAISIYFERKRKNQQLKKGVDEVHRPNYIKGYTHSTDQPEEFLDAPQPHEVPFLIMEPSNDGVIFTGSDKEFIVTSVIILVIVAIIQGYVLERLPSPVQWMGLLIFFSGIVILLHEYMKWFSNILADKGILGIWKGSVPFILSLFILKIFI